MIKITRQFHFDAAHRLNGYGDTHPNDRIHGHSFRVRVTVTGTLNERGQILDMDELSAQLETVRAQLDHHMLNDIDGLAQPTLEHIAIWIWDYLRPHVPEIMAVEVARDSLGQSCVYEG